MSESQNKPTEKAEKTQEDCGIVEVYADNFVSEIKKMSELLSEYNYVGMDTEFPGTVYSLQNYSQDFYYKSLKLNIDYLKLIQLGITLSNKNGEHPKGTHTWQFNLKFDYTKDKYENSSFSLLCSCGIDFKKLKKNGIDHQLFAEYFMTSGLVLNEDIHWVSFHGSYDFGYLLKLLINSQLPEKEETFTEELKVYFPSHYDIRILVQSNDNLQGGLNRVAQKLDITRFGKVHQAGSDSIVTIDIFFKLLKTGLIDNETLENDENIIFGLGFGADDNETINYTKIGSGDGFGNFAAYQNYMGPNMSNPNVLPGAHLQQGQSNYLMNNFLKDYYNEKMNLNNGLVNIMKVAVN